MDCSGVKTGSTRVDNTCGVMYVAVQCTTDKYLNEACRSVRSLRKHNPDIPTAFVTDRVHAVKAKKDAHGLFDHVISIPRARVSSKMVLSARILAFASTPFKRTLYLDGDTSICHDISDMFGVLDYYDIGMVYTTHRLWRKGADIYGMEIPEWLPEFNGGMILYRTSGMMTRMFIHWKRLHLEMGEWNDQMALRTTLWYYMQNYGLMIYPMPCEYNVWLLNSQTLGMTARIVHGRRELQEICGRINQIVGPRQWMPHPVNNLLHWDNFLRTYHKAGRKK